MHRCDRDPIVLSFERARRLRRRRDRRMRDADIAAMIMGAVWIVLLGYAFYTCACALFGAQAR